MSVYQWLCLLGIPGIFTALLGWVAKKLKANDKETKAVERGVQALLRAQMVADYNRYEEKGWAPIYARENFENCWTQYHALGANGVMDDLHSKFLALPTAQKGETHEGH